MSKSMTSTVPARTRQWPTSAAETAALPPHPSAVIGSPQPRLLLPRHQPFPSPAAPAHGPSRPRSRPLPLPPMAMAKPARAPLTISPTHDRPCLQPNPSTPPARLSPCSWPSLPTAVRRLAAIQRDEETKKNSERQGRVLKRITGRQITLLPRHMN